MPLDTNQTARRVIAQHPATRDDISDLVTRRPLPGPPLEQLDPSVLTRIAGLKQSLLF